MNQIYLETTQHSFFSGDNVTVMVCVSIAALIFIFVTTWNYLDNRKGVEKEITVAQIKADATVKAAQLEAQWHIEVATIEGEADKVCAQLESGSPKLETT